MMFVMWILKHFCIQKIWLVDLCRGWRVYPTTLGMKWINSGSWNFVLNFIESHQNWPIFLCFWCYHCFDDTKNGRLCQDVEEEVEAKVWCLQLLIRLRRSNFFFPRRDPSNEEVPALTFQSLRVLTKLSLRGHRWFTTFDFFWGPGTCWSGALSRWYEENFQTPLKLNIVIKYCHVSHQLPFPTHHFGYPFFQKSTVHHWRF